MAITFILVPNIVKIIYLGAILLLCPQASIFEQSSAMIYKYRKDLTGLMICLFLAAGQLINAEVNHPAGTDKSYAAYVRECMDLLMAYGTDTYGPEHTPVLVSILDVESRISPADPLELDEAWRVIRRERRNPAGANLLSDNALLKTMLYLSLVTGDASYEAFAGQYADYYLRNLVDSVGLIWWGWHRHYDVFLDSMDGHAGNHHEIHAINCINWEHLWQINGEAVEKEIEALWQWHVIDKHTGEINRHGDGLPGCDFSMSSGAIIEAFSFLYSKTKERVWLDRAKLLADYYWERRNRDTDLFPERPNAGWDRFDGSSFVTSIPGLYCHSLLKAYEMTGVSVFKDEATGLLKAYARYGFDETAGKFWGALRLDGTPLTGPMLLDDYAQYEPRGHLDLWEPYAAGYQYAIYTAQAYAFAYQFCQEPLFLTTAERFADWIMQSPPGSPETAQTWYREYSEKFAPKGTYAGKYGRTISFFIHMYIITREKKYLEEAEALADTAIGKLYHKGLFRGHPAKPYYEAMDGVGYLMYALLELDLVLTDPEKVLSDQAILIGKGENVTAMDLDNW